MKLLCVFALLLLPGIMGGTPLVSFGSEEEEGEPILGAVLALDKGRLATIAVVGADPTKAHLVREGGSESLELILHDPVSRLTIFKQPEGWDGGAAARRGSAFDLQPGDPVYLKAGGQGQEEQSRSD